MVIRESSLVQQTSVPLGLLAGDKKIAQPLVLDKIVDFHARFLEHRIIRTPQIILVERIIRMTHDQNRLEGIQLNHGMFVVLQKGLFLRMRLCLIVAMREHIGAPVAHGSIRTVIWIVGPRLTHLSVHSEIEVHL